MPPERRDRFELRRNNLSAVLRSVADAGPLTRADLVTRTGLNRGTVIGLVADLVSRGLVDEVGSRQGDGAGRPTALLDIDQAHTAAITAEVGPTGVTLEASTLRGSPITGASAPITQRRDLVPARVVRRVADATRVMIGDLEASGYGCAGIVLTIPGALNSSRGLVHSAPSLGWENVHLGGLVQSAVGVESAPLMIERLGHLAAEAERGHGRENLVVLFADEGLGGGATVSGSSVLGAQGLGGEFAHIVVDPRGPRCSCGARGCLAAFVSIRALAERHSEALAPPPDSTPRLLADLVHAAAVRGHRGIIEDLRKQSVHLGLAVTTLVNIFDPDAVILGGWLGVLGEWLTPGVQAVLDERLAGPRRSVPVHPSTEPYGATRRGGARVLLDRLVHDPTVLPARRTMS
ncbi:ROK family transcriptional regulator [Tsukamurella spumae]|uniref:ROK family transcriptional regulator n=1 Tax=Tsukamurella spumae TaxID=44753 RepID=A0A846WZL5_9ACTN|nr:ROK family transcriptional regulator [Tsukamurella spumae]NKY17180.1 ROK family transcriptional regulator [Tsukamurella spumae]